jgi:hypothetical protein
MTILSRLLQKVRAAFFTPKPAPAAAKKKKRRVQLSMTHREAWAVALLCGYGGLTHRYYYRQRKEFATAAYKELGHPIGDFVVACVATKTEITQWRNQCAYDDWLTALFERAVSETSTIIAAIVTGADLRATRAATNILIAKARRSFLDPAPTAPGHVHVVTRSLGQPVFLQCTDNGTSDFLVLVGEGGMLKKSTLRRSGWHVKKGWRLPFDAPPVQVEQGENAAAVAVLVPGQAHR